MKRIIVFIILSSLNGFVNGQTYIPLPTEKPQFTLSGEESYYSHRIKKLEILNNVIFHQDSFQIEYINQCFYNRFATYFNLLTDDPNDLLYIFFDALRNDKDDFCYSYNSIIREQKISQKYKYSYYKAQLPIMNVVCDCVYKSYNKVLCTQLDTIADRDQRYRGEVSDLDKQAMLDSINILEALEIYEKWGYPGKHLVGVERSNILFYVIQHSNLEMMERFLPVIKDETDKANLNSKNYCLLYDRICVLKGLPQHFGTQYIEKNGTWVLYKHINLDKMNENRIKYSYDAIENDE
ncbi:MAG: hypothetical protein R2766_12635 [Saprospiraceae bacterium]